MEGEKRRVWEELISEKSGVEGKEKCKWRLKKMRENEEVEVETEGRGGERKEKWIWRMN